MCFIQKLFFVRNILVRKLWENLLKLLVFLIERMALLKIIHTIDKTWFFIRNERKLVVKILKHCFQFILLWKFSTEKRENSHKLFKRTKQPHARSRPTLIHFCSIFFLSQNFPVAFIYHSHTESLLTSSSSLKACWKPRHSQYLHLWWNDFIVQDWKLRYIPPPWVDFGERGSTTFLG